jgi:hypothetical protein
VGRLKIYSITRIDLTEDSSSRNIQDHQASVDLKKDVLNWLVVSDKAE